MNKTSVVKTAQTTNFVASTKGLLQRNCACGNHTGTGGECTNCAGKKLQKKLSIGATNDPLELEADRVADQVLAYQPAHSFSNISAPKIQRRTEQSSPQSEEVPASVERVLASSGSPLPPMVRNDMEQRFGQDFSRVRMHTNSAAEQSAREVNANAYTVGNNIVFNRGKFSPETQDGKRLLAHELTHVVQQSNAVRIFGNSKCPSSTINPPSTLRKLQRDVAEGASVPASVGSEYSGGGGSSGGGGASGGWENDAVQRMFPKWTKMSLPSTLEFYHGTRWSIAQNIGRIEPRGIGDFGAGFYTHFEPENNPAALNRAKERGQWAAKQPPQEPYVGVLSFKIPTKSFINLLNTRSRVFPLRDLKQHDYAERQREWLNYITKYGREPAPGFFADRYNVERWRHYELQSPSVPSDALTIGPFYTPRQGLPGQPPPRSEFQPKALEPVTAPTSLQQQVVWANEGIDMLNANPKDALQFDRETGDPIVPPIPATFAPPQGGQRYTSQNPSDE